jgi:hypothetical protein
MPDPLPRSAPDFSPVPATEYPLWIPDELWPELFADEALLCRAERWLSEAPLPNPRVFVRGRIEPWQDAAVLAASLFRRGHQSCIDQAVWVASIGVPTAVAALFKRDTPHRWFSRLHEEFVGLGDAVYTSPALACWAPWLTREGDAQTYISLDHMGRPVEVTRYPLVASVTTWYEDEHPREPDAWSPAPVLRSALGIVGAVGDRYQRQYVDHAYRPVAIERDVPHAEWSFSHHYLGIDFHTFADTCATAGLVPMWVVRLWREATPALYMKGHDCNIPQGLVHRSRDTHWLLSWDEPANDFAVATLQDVLQPWIAESDAESSGSMVGSDADKRRYTGSPPRSGLRSATARLGRWLRNLSPLFSLQPAAHHPPPARRASRLAAHAGEAAAAALARWRHCSWRGVDDRVGAAGGGKARVISLYVDAGQGGIYYRHYDFPGTGLGKITRQGSYLAEVGLGFRGKAL